MEIEALEGQSDVCGLGVGEALDFSSDVGGSLSLSLGFVGELDLGELVLDEFNELAVVIDSCSDDDDSVG